MWTNWYTVVKDSKHTTVKAHCALSAALGLYPVKPVFWKEISSTVTIVNGTILVTKINLNM